MLPAPPARASGREWWAPDTSPAGIEATINGMKDTAGGTLTRVASPIPAHKMANAVGSTLNG